MLEIQAHVRHRVDWHSLMVSRHITWMVPVTAPLVIVPLAVILVCAGACACWRWRSRRGRRASPSGGGVGLGLGGNGPGHALASRPTPRHCAFSTRRRRSPWRWASVFDSGTGWFAR